MKKLTALAFLFTSLFSFAQSQTSLQWKELLHAEEAAKRVQLNINDGNYKAAMQFTKNIISANETLLSSNQPSNYENKELKPTLLRLEKYNTQLKMDLENPEKVKQNIQNIHEIVAIYRSLNQMKRE